MAKTKAILTERSKSVLTITLNRPEVLNAVNGPLTEQLFEELAAVENDARVRCVVIRGGGGHFMAGGDLKLFHGELDRDSEERRRHFEKFVYQVHPLIQVIKRLPKPVVASVQGAAGGFGVSLMVEGWIDERFTTVMEIVPGGSGLYEVDLPNEAMIGAMTLASTDLQRALLLEGSYEAGAWLGVVNWVGEDPRPLGSFVVTKVD